MSVTKKNQIKAEHFQGQCYAQAKAAIKQLNLAKLRLIQLDVNTEILKRKASRARQKGVID